LETEVTARSDFQYYAVRSPFGSPEIRRERYLQTLGLGVYDLQGSPNPRHARWSFVSRVRFDADLGLEAAEHDPSAVGSYVPGLDSRPLDLMFGYLEGRNLAGGRLGLKVGRQYVTDSLGWWSMDGGLVSVITPIYLALDAYGGFEQRGGLPLMSTSRFSADGVYRGSRRGLETGEWPSYLEESKLAPAYGASLRTAGLGSIRARVDWRKVLERDTVVVSPFVGPTGRWEVTRGNRVSSERAGGEFELFDPGLGSLSAGAVYDLYAQVWSERQASLDWYATERWVVGVAYEFYLPTFDGDSVYNWFSHQGMTLVTLDSSLSVSRELDLTATSGVRRFATEGDPEDSSANRADATERAIMDVTGSLVATYRISQSTLGIRAAGEAGRGGHLVGTDVTVRRWFAAGTYDGLAILSLYDWSDALRPIRNATSFTYVLGAGIHPSSRARLGVEWEHTTSRLVGQRFRLLGTLDLAVLP
jgi:hypothetical protein